jgi:TM2 domain-containing membrane protein YozV
MKKPKANPSREPPDNSPGDRDKMLNALAAASLSIFGGMGHLYLGVERRGYLFITCSVGMIVIAKFFWPTAWFLYLQWVILTAFDAFAFAKRGRGFF